MKTARFWTAEENGAVRCALCPHRCRIPAGGRSRCYGRVNRGGELLAETWGRPVAIQVDPIEKKPLNHFLPGRRILSLGLLGCNLSCRFCQNWELSHPAPDVAPPDRLVLPEDVAAAAVREGIPAVAATYNEPAVWAEYALDVAAACHARGLRMVAVTSGYFSPESRLEFFRNMDAANVDLKSFRDDFYRRLCGAHLAPVLETLEAIRKETSCWLEVTTLLIPGLNDSDAEIDELIADHYKSEAQTLTTGAEANLLKFRALTGTLAGAEAARWAEITRAFKRNLLAGSLLAVGALVWAQRISLRKSMPTA